MKEIRHNETVDNLKTLARFIAGLVFTYLMGHVVMSLLFYLELTDFNISKDIDVILHFAFGLPVLYAQIRVTEYAVKLKNQL